jgi:hypothetical protein
MIGSAIYEVFADHHSRNASNSIERLFTWHMTTG